jgi:hypothetical protein
MEVVAADKKIAFVLYSTALRRTDGHPVLQRLNAATVKQYNSPDPDSALVWRPIGPPPAHHEERARGNSGEMAVGTVDNPDLSEIERRYLSKLDFQLAGGSQYNIHISETLSPADTRQWCPAAEAAKAKEIQGLMDRETFEVVMREEIPAFANIIGSRFVMALYYTETEQPVWKAGFAAQCHTDAERHTLVQNAKSLRQTSIRLIVALAAMFGFKVSSGDVSQAYLQAVDRLARQVYLRPTRELRLRPGAVLKLLRPLYELADSGDAWANTFFCHVRHDLKMSNLDSDMAFFSRWAR